MSILCYALKMFLYLITDYYYLANILQMLEEEGGLHEKWITGLMKFIRSSTLEREK